MKRRGQAVTEFSLLLPIFMSLTLGSFDAGSLVWQRLVMEFALEDGCRSASLVDVGQGRVYQSTVAAQLAQTVDEVFEEFGVSCQSCTTSVTIDDDTTTSIASYKCRVERTTTSVTGLIPPMNMTGTMLVRMEYQR